MNANRLLRHRLQRGQTLIIAVLVLAVLLILGFVFLGILNRNISQAGRAQQRSVGSDLASAGAVYAHNQLVYSEMRADWRPSAVALSAAGDFTRDPDALYLRQATAFGLRGPADTLKDMGGPDGLGPFGRVNFAKGRALVRVRYAPSDANVFDTSPTGPLRVPGRAKNMLVIEVVGRPGRIDTTDPTTQLNNGGIKYQNYTGDAEFRAAFAEMKERDGQFQSSRKLIAYASIGIIDNALFITGRDESSREAEIGFPPEAGATYNGAAVQPTIQIGAAMDGPGASTISGGGSIRSNVSLKFFGNTSLILNQDLGDNILVAGKIKAADAAANLMIRRTRGDDFVTTDDDTIALSQTTGVVNGIGTTDRLNSDDPLFGTISQLLRDGIQAMDPQGNPRYVGQLKPPSFTDVNTVTGINSYYTITRNSGVLLNGNTGSRGHGSGPYIDNIDDRQMRADENGREDTGTEESLIYDWLNPNNGQARSGWQGPFYVPVGAYVRLVNDGFYITRDGRAPAARRTWRNPNGSDSGLSTIRYRLGGDPDGLGPQPPYIINSLTNPADINAANPVWTNGLPFNGVVFFEGNVRIRGTIPTDVQMNVISMATIYIEGSITKGVVDAGGNLLTRPSRSALMLMAKDYVALNTTEFFGVASGQGLEEVDENPESANPVRVATAGSLTLSTDFLYRSEIVPGLPAVTPNNPSSWRAFMRDYVDPSSNNALDTMLLVSHATDGALGNSVIAGDINYGTGNSGYNFLDIANGNPAVYGPRKVLGINDYGRNLKYETLGLPLVHPTTALWAGSTVTSTGAEGTYQMFIGAPNDVSISVPNDMPSYAPGQAYKVRRAAIVPHDVKIEAAIYAQDGAFTVIPGAWFNPDSNDRRDTYAALGTNQAERDLARLQQFGSYPETPFYGEPLDVRVQIIGAVSMNMPAPISMQSEWLKKWGWIPREQGISGKLIPSVHVPAGYDITAGSQFVPNLIMVHDPMLVTGRTTGYRAVPDSYVRFTRVQPDPVNNPAFTVDYPLPPMPRLPVSPTLSYFGEVNP